jgi:proteasome lid subunit RPN8/RPN11
MNEGDIQFGEIEQRPIETAGRPDQDRDVAVCPYGSPDPDQMRIFVSFDAFAEMETHAHSDPAVELGGVLVGKQYKDERGRPFVMVADSLRAKHYESTASRFTYTHQTWGEITREKDEHFPKLDIVGWYHTHPGWGIFLSGHDTFIHENYFAQALDVAYVIDPVNEDRGFFTWAAGAGGRTLPQTAGFFVYAPRSARAALEATVSRVENSRKPEMVAAAGNPIIVQTPPSRPSGFGLAAVVVGMILLLQTAVLTAIYRSMLERDPDSIARRAREEEQAKLTKAGEELDREKLRLDAERKLLFELTHRIDLPDGPIAKQWEDIRRKALDGADKAAEWQTKASVAAAAAENIQKKSDEFRARIERQQKEIEDLKQYKAKSDELARRVTALEKKEKELDENKDKIALYEKHKENIDKVEQAEGNAEFWRSAALMAMLPFAVLGWGLAGLLFRGRGGAGDAVAAALPAGGGSTTGAAAAPPNAARKDEVRFD